MVLKLKILNAFENLMNFNIIVENLMGFQNHKIQGNFIALKFLEEF